MNGRELRGGFSGLRFGWIEWFGVSEIGTRFVWQECLFSVYVTELQEIFERLPVRAVQKRLVALHVLEVVVVCQLAPGALELVGADVEADSGVEQALFQGQGTLQTMGGSDHSLHEIHLYPVARLKLLDVVVEDFVEVLLAFVFQENAFGEKPVFESVLGRAVFTCRCFRSPGEGTVASGCCNASL